MKKILLALFIVSSHFASAQSIIKGTVSIQGGELLPGVNVFLEGTYDGASTNLDGQFQFKTDETGDQKLVITFIGYQKQEHLVTLPGNVNINISLKEAINRLDAVVISAGAFSAGEETNREVLKPLDIVTTAGATADIAGALNTLPGTQTVGETGRLFVRGGDGYETRTFIDGLEVPDSYGISAPNTPSRSRFSPFMFSGTSFSTGGYSAEYGGALSSALVLNTKDIASQNRTDFSLMSVGGDVAHTQAFDRASVTAKMQYTNLEPYFQLVNQKINYEKAPESIVGNASFRQQVGNDGMLKVYGNFSRSDLIIFRPQILNETEEDKIDLSNDYNHINVNYKDILNEKWSFKTGASYTTSSDDINLNDDHFVEQSEGSHVKAVLSFDPTSSFSLSFGGEQFHKNNSFDIKETGAPTFKYSQNIGAAFTEADIYISNDFVLRSGVRVEYDDLTNNVDLFPRASLAHKLGNKGQVSFAYGRFNQQAQPEYLRVDNNLQPERAEHFILNYQIISAKRTFRIESFYKQYSKLVKFNDPFDKSSFSNSGNGYAKGFDIFWRDNRTFKNLDYWISYSYIDTERDYRDYPTKSIPSFSSTHNFSVVTKYFITDLKTQVGATYSFASKRRYNDPNQLEFNNGKTPYYHDLSLNISYLYKSNIIIHGSVTNLLGIDNIFGYEYSDQQNAQGQYVGRAVKQAAPRFIFLGVFITLSKSKLVNQLPNL